MKVFAMMKNEHKSLANNGSSILQQHQTSIGNKRNNIAPMSNYNTPTDFSSASTPGQYMTGADTLKRLSKVNPNLLIQWQGITTNNQINGSGLLRVSERSKDITKKGNLVFSLEANQWKNNKPIGQVKMTSIIYFDLKRQKQRRKDVSFCDQDNSQKSAINLNTTRSFYRQSKKNKILVKQIRKYEGNTLNLNKHGYGQYTIEYHYSNETKETVLIKGQWQSDFIKTGTVIKNGKQERQVNFINNIQMDSARLTLSRKTILGLDNQNSHDNQENENKVDKNKKSTQRKISEEQRIFKKPIQVLKENQQNDSWIDGYVEENKKKMQQSQHKINIISKVKKQVNNISGRNNCKEKEGDVLSQVNNKDILKVENTIKNQTKNVKGLLEVPNQKKKK